MRKIISIITIFIFTIISIYSVTYDEITITTQTSNSSINFTTIAMTIDAITISSDFIYLENISYNNGNFNVTSISNYNHSITNNTIYSYEFPRIYSQTGSSIKIISNISETLNTNVIILGITSQPTYIKYISNNDTYSKIYSSSEYSWDNSTNKLTINITGIETGYENRFIFTAPTGIATEGGSGGGSYGKRDCDIFLSSNHIYFNNNINSNEIIIKNNETNYIGGFSYKLEYVSGDLNVFNQISLLDKPNVLYPDVENSIIISSFKSILGNSEGKLIISNDLCNDIEINISSGFQEIKITKIDKQFLTLFPVNQTIINIVDDLSNSKIKEFSLEKTPKTFSQIIFSFFGIGLLISIVFGFMYWKRKDREPYLENLFFDIFIRIVFWLISSGIVFFLLWVIKVTWFSGD